MFSSFTAGKLMSANQFYHEEQKTWQVASACQADVIDRLSSLSIQPVCSSRNPCQVSTPKS
jgi:hypothetical protein